jgi:hypothetical protein
MPASHRLPRPRTSHARRGSLRELYTNGLVSIFRRPSLFRLWEPLRETPRPLSAD